MYTDVAYTQSLSRGVHQGSIQAVLVKRCTLRWHTGSPCQEVYTDVAYTQSLSRGVHQGSIQAVLVKRCTLRWHMSQPTVIPIERLSLRGRSLTELGWVLVAQLVNTMKLSNEDKQ